MLWSIQTRDGLLGPYNVKQIRSLARAGVVSADTPLVNSGGRKVLAKQLSGMTFGAPQNIEPPPPLTESTSPGTCRLQRRWILIGGAMCCLGAFLRRAGPGLGHALRQHQERKRQEEQANSPPLKFKIPGVQESDATKVPNGAAPNRRL